MAIDRRDRRILDELQRDGALSVGGGRDAKLGLSNDDLLAAHPAARAGRRDPPPRRPARPRGARARRDGVRARETAQSQGRDALAQFERAIRDRPEVLDCCTTDGRVGFPRCASSRAT